jgi:hypothetical protein
MQEEEAYGAYDFKSGGGFHEVWLLDFEFQIYFKITSFFNNLKWF